MAEMPLLWVSGARKEVMELLQSLWKTGGPKIRERIANSIVAGPPSDSLGHVDATQREQSRDRRIFDRLAVIQRVGDPPLNATLRSEAARLRELYPQWQISDGDKALFGAWMEFRRGPATNYTVDDLKSLDDDALLKVLINDHEAREGTLDAWRQLAIDQPKRAIDLLTHLAQHGDPPAVDIWEYGLMGVRDAANKLETRDPIIELLTTIEPALFEQPSISDAICDVLEVVTRGQPSPTNDAQFWKLFDRAAQAVDADPQNSDAPDDDWVSFAINRSAGKLATAFFGALFARDLRVGSGIPEDLRPRLDRLLSPGIRSHRLERVIAASRLSYLFAVDPAWTEASLIPRFDWATDEEEALAVWQGYAWQPRIDRKLWTALRPYFLPMFRHDRLGRLGDGSKNLVQLLTLVGVEFGLNEIPPKDARNAIRVMSDEMRAESISWIANFLEQSIEGEINTDLSQEHPADALWTKSIEPWIDRVWPPDAGLQSPSTAAQFALVAIAVANRFPDAVAALKPYLMPRDDYYLLHKLAESSHPEDHPAATLDFIDAVIDVKGAAQREMPRIMERIRAADSTIATKAVFKRWDERLRQNSK